MTATIPEQAPAPADVEDLPIPPAPIDQLRGAYYAIGQLLRRAGDDPGVLGPVLEDVRELYLVAAAAAEHVEGLAEDAEQLDESTR